jgi:thiol-disulfide isomerase/thioredoxin
LSFKAIKTSGKEERMRLEGAFAFRVFGMVLAGLIVAGNGWAEKPNIPFPSYGSGALEVRIYTNYFCPPCRAMEPDVEPILKELLKRNTIRLILVDVPFDERTNLFARNFLYAIRAKNDLEHALNALK